MATLDRFIPETDLPPDFMMIMYGMRRSGKTTALMHMLESMKKRFEKHKAHVFCGTAQDNPKQWKNFPMNCVHGDISKIDEGIGKIIDEQREAIQEEVKRQMSDKQVQAPAVPDQTNDKKVKKGALSAVKSRKRKRGKNHGVIPVEGDKGPDNDLERFPGEVVTNNDNGNREMSVEDLMMARRDNDLDETLFPHVLLVLDDVVSEETIRHSPRLNQLAVSGRHVFISVVILSQCVCGSGSVPPTIRNNSDYVMIVKNPRSSSERKLLREQYLTASNKKEAGAEGLRVLEAVTSVKFRILVINVSADGAQFRDYLFTYGPTPPAPDNVSAGFRLGTEAQWDADKKSKREPQFTSKDFLKDPPKGPPLQQIDSGRFSVGASHGVAGDVHLSRGIQRFVSRHAEFLDPYF